MLDTEGFEVIANQIHHFRDGEIAEHRKPLAVASVQPFAAVALCQTMTGVFQILARI